MSIITIVGSGMMGTAMATPARANGHTVRLVGTPLDAAIVASIRATGIHPGYNRKVPEGVECFPFEELDHALEGAELLIGGVSSFGVEWFAQEVLTRIPAALPVLSVTKGLQDLPDGGLIPIPQLLASLLPAGEKRSLNAIGGPCTSYELADRHHSAVAFCGEDIETLRFCKRLLETDFYHISLSTDVVGVECAVALKNAYAVGVSLAIGMAQAQDGPGCVEHYNPQAALFGQGLREISRWLAFLGAGPENIVYGGGDLYVTVFGGRTRRLGTLLGRGLRMQEALQQLNGVTLESVVITTRMARALRKLDAAGKLDARDFPLLTHIDALLNQDAKLNIPWTAFETEVH